MNSKDPQASAKVGKGSAVMERAIEEVRRFMILFLYLWVYLSLFVLDQTVMSRQHELNLLPHGFALINALVLAKVMLVAEDLDLARWLTGRPAAWTIVYESALCSALLICFHIIEELVIDLFRGIGITGNMPSIGGGGWRGVVVVALILFVSLLPFFAFKNVTRAIGTKRMKEILFRSSRFHTEQR